MENNARFVSITESTAFGARDRVLDDLNELTDGNAEKAIKYVQEFLELESICEEFRDKEQPKWGEPCIVPTQLQGKCTVETTILNDFNKGIR